MRVVENWNSANDKIDYGRKGVITGADREHAEVSMLALHLLQFSLVWAWPAHRDGRRLSTGCRRARNAPRD